jgi:hypothetical protein
MSRRPGTWASYRFFFFLFSFFFLLPTKLQKREKNQTIPFPFTAPTYVLSTRTHNVKKKKIL